MKKNLRLLCLGLATATFTCGFAQTDMTSELKNADMEQALKGWSFDGTDVMGKNSKDPSSKVGFHGMNKGVQETWHSNPENPLGDSYIMQRVKQLPAGTYVFGAYVGAAKQTPNLVESNRDTICGVTLFANKNSVAVATDNPDLGWKYDWAHSSKFNVATKVADEGTLYVGLNIENTTANYVVWDNATLYYFGDMSEEDALDAMAQIDVNNAVAIADTLVNGIAMQADTLTNLTDAIAAAKKAKVTNASLWDDLEPLFYNMGLARRSATDYANLKKHIESATVVANAEWSEDGKAAYFDGLKDALDAAVEAYAAAQADRDEINELRAELSRQVGWMRVDSFYTARQELQAFINSSNTFTNEPGKYTTFQQEQLKALDKQLGDTLKVIEDPKNLDPRPQDLYPYIAQVYAAIENVKNNPISLEPTEMPIVFERSETTLHTAAGNHHYIEGAVLNSDNLVSYTSPMYRFLNKIEKFRITVKSSGSNKSFFCLSSLEFYDVTGKKIDLTEDNITSNADHNTLNPGAEDGGGFAALFDGDKTTFFHSAWKNAPSEAHYLEVTLPNGGYDAFSFVMVAREDRSQGGDQHNFPGEMEINTPTPNRDAMMIQLNEAKKLNPYIGTDPGFYNIEDNENPEVFVAITEAIAEAEALIANNGAESAMPAVETKLKEAIYAYSALTGDKVYNLPVAGKAYRLISGYNGYFEKQKVEKAMTISIADSTLWWENVTPSKTEQEFVFNPILDADGDPVVEQVAEGQNEDGSDILVPYYCYTMKNVKYELYADSAFTGSSLKMVEEALDTVKLKWLGRGQWNIIVKGNVLHTGDHNSGNPGNTPGAYGGTWGIESRIVPYGGGIDGASAWFIREMPAMPCNVEVANGKSNCIHFAATNTLTLTAAGCDFNGLALYDVYGTPINFDVVVENGVATVTTKSVITGCSIALNGVSSVELNAEFVEVASDWMTTLEDKYEEVLAIAPEQGTAVGQYDDITEYTETLQAAEEMISYGAEDAELKAMVAQLDSAVAHLNNPHMPEAGKYYFIVSGLPAFEANLGYNVGIYPKNSMLCWAHEHVLDSARCWQFEPATLEELKGVNADTTAVAFYIKNLGSGEYMGTGDAKSTQLGMVSGKDATAPYVVSSLQQGTAVAIASVKDASNRLHGAGHNEGKSKSGTIVYWNSGLGSSSAWRIVETENDFVLFSKLDFTEIEPEAAVIKGVYDLFGRRLVAPTAPGIYIIDGKKRVIK